MKTTAITKASVSLAFIFACLLPLNLAAQEMALAGQKIPQFRFRQVVMNGSGLVTRDHFVGRPLLIEFWGFR